MTRFVRTHVSGCLVLLVVALVVVAPASAATTVTVGTDPTKIVMKGKIVTPDQVIDGELVIEGDTITCVAAVARLALIGR